MNACLHSSGWFFYVRLSFALLTMKNRHANPVAWNVLSRPWLWGSILGIYIRKPVVAAPFDGDLQTHLVMETWASALLFVFLIHVFKFFNCFTLFHPGMSFLPGSGIADACRIFCTAYKKLPALHKKGGELLTVLNRIRRRGQHWSVWCHARKSWIP